MGSRLIPLLAARGHRITAVVRPGSESKLPAGTEVVPADVLDARTWEDRVRPFHTLVHLVGVAHPSPAKAQQFIDIDRRGAMEATRVARNVGVGHFVYVSVAQPAPAMKAYLAVRAECEEAVRAAHLNATILRPWYVLRPGHWWPLALVPFYKLAEAIPATAAGATRLGLVPIGDMLAALTVAVENPVAGVKIVDVPGIGAVAREVR